MGGILSGDKHRIKSERDECWAVCRMAESGNIQPGAVEAFLLYHIFQGLHQHGKIFKKTENCHYLLKK